MNSLRLLFQSFAGAFSPSLIVKDVSKAKKEDDVGSNLICLGFLSFFIWGLFLSVFVVKKGEWPISVIATSICIFVFALGFVISSLPQREFSKTWGNKAAIREIVRSMVGLAMFFASPIFVLYSGIG